MTQAQRVWSLTAVLATVGAVLFLSAVHDLSPVGAPIAIPWWALAALFGLAEVFVIHLRFGGNAHSFSLSEVPLVLGLFFIDGSGLLVAQLVGVAAALTLSRRQSLVRVGFNIAQLFLCTSLAVVIFTAILPVGQSLDPMGWLAAASATVFANLFSGLMINLAISAAEGRAPDLSLIVDISSGFVLANTCLGLVAVTVLWIHPVTAWLLPVLAATIFLAYRAYTSMKRRHETLALLYRSSQLGQESLRIDATLRTFLERARETFKADVAEVMLFPETEGEPGHRTVFGPRDAVGSMVPHRLDPTEGVWARVAAEGQGLLLPRPLLEGRLKTYFDARGIRDAVVVPLRRDARVVGTMMIGNRLGEFSTFEPEDLTTLETVANHLSVALRNAQLVESLSEQLSHNEHLAYHDPLTGLPNRTALQHETDAAIRAARLDNSAVAILAINLDHFKEVNDTLGHETGDRLLDAVGHRIRQLVVDNGTVARLGGDEFGVLLRDTRETAATAIVTELISLFDAPFLIDEVALQISARAGIALYPNHGNDAAMLLQRSDVAMHQAKHATGGYQIYEPTRDHYTPERLTMAVDLRRAVERSELELVYQPKVSLADRHLVGVEALVRWDRRGHGAIAPDVFIPLAEHTGLIRLLTSAVLENALEQQRDWAAAGLPLKVAVNLSARDICDPGLPADVAGLIERLGVTPAGLQVEITETALMSDPIHSLDVLTALRDAGIEIAIDDFGTGYSSLSHLSRLPVDEIKVDRSFVMQMLESKSHAAIVQATIDLAKNLGLRVVAEGIEDQSVWDRLNELGCDIGQGYFLARPMPAKEINRWIAHSGFPMPADAAASRRSQVVSLANLRR